MDFKKNPLTQSIIHKFLFKGDEREKLCPKNAYCTAIAKTHDYVTESMRKGNYFESLCLGRCADGKVVTDLPRKTLSKTNQLINAKRKQIGLPEMVGEKTLDQLRIEEQARRFKALCAKYQVQLNDSNVQVRVIIPWDKNPDIWLSGGFDIFPTTMMTPEGLEMAIIDMKLTIDVNSSFGEFCWGSPEFMDLTQAYLYSYLVRNVVKHPDLNPHLKDLLTKPAVNLIMNNRIYFYYWVFSYKKPEEKLLKIDWNADREKELNETIRKTVSLIEYYENLGWPAKPDYKVCKECTVFECEKRSSIQTI